MSWSSDKRINSKNFDSYLDSIINEPEVDKIEMQPIPIENDNEVINNDDNEEDNNTDLPQKMDVMLLTQGWNDKNERIVISIGENAASYKWMHEKSASEYAFYHKIFGILMIVFSTGLTAESILPNDSTLALYIIRRVFTYIITILAVIANFLKLAKLSQQHMTSAIAFSKLYHDIQQQMCMYRRNRKNATNYVADVLKQYDTLIVNGPSISSRVITNFKNTFKSANIALPDIADRIQKIEIVTEAPTQAQSQQVNFQDIKNKRYGRYGLNNLEQIHNCFQISGDITDNDIQNASASQLKEMRQKYLAGVSDFEYQRFKSHSEVD